VRLEGHISVPVNPHLWHIISHFFGDLRYLEDPGERSGRKVSFWITLNPLKPYEMKQLGQKKAKKRPQHFYDLREHRPFI
jgi:hypothetical protein